MTKLRVTLTAVREIEFSPDLYPGMSLDDAIVYKTQVTHNVPCEFVECLADNELDVSVSVIES